VEEATMPKHTSLALYRSGRRWTETEAREALSALDASGLSATEFAYRQGIDAQRLYWWRRRLANSSNEAAPSFVELSASSVGIGHVEVILRSGHIVWFSAALETSVLRRWVAALEPDAC
jgi:hypothetical protein